MRDTVRAMLTRKFYQVALSLGLVFAATSSVTACSTQPTVKTADHIKSGALPDGGQWEGVYYNQVLGFLHITENSGAVQGAWRTTAGDKWGELYGEVDGDILRYTWTERKIGVVGPAAESKGKGYFRYVLGSVDGEAHELKGEWGLGEDEVGQTWDCIKQTNQEADPKSVRPNELESRVGASGFDGAKGDADISEKKEEPEEGAEGEGEDGDADGADNDPL